MKTRPGIVISTIIALIILISITIEEKATFAGGCFWCMEPPFEALQGVGEVVVGYTGGYTKNPTYGDVSAGGTGHYEAVQLKYNPLVISYDKLLQVYWRQIDPTDDGGQFVDRGAQYGTAIFYHNQRQKELAEKSRQELDMSGIFDRPVVTLILPTTTFYLAEDHHQNYYTENPESYEFYKLISGRDSFFPGNSSNKRYNWYTKNLSGL
jgi:methionine-S-sulfoxide reductase